MFTPVEVAPQLSSYVPTRIVIFSGNLYAGTTDGALIRWNGSNAWIEEAPQLAGNTDCYDMFVMGSYIYMASTSGKLVRWGVGDSVWTQIISTTPGGGGVIYSLTELSSELYGFSASTFDGRLYKWDGVVSGGSWIEVAPKFGTGPGYESLALITEHSGSILAFSGTNGYLQEENTGSWVQKAPSLTTSVSPTCIVSLAGTVYVTHNNDWALYKWDGVSAWSTVIADSGSLQTIQAFEYNSEIYAVENSGSRARIGKWDGVDPGGSWEIITDVLSTLPYTKAIGYNNYIYAIKSDGKLYEIGEQSSESPSLSPSASESASSSPSSSPSESLSESPSSSPSESLSESPSLSASDSSSLSPSNSSSFSPSESISESSSISPSNSSSISPSQSESPSDSLSESSSESASESPSPSPSGSEYYVDASQLSTGDGSELSPWNYEQLRNYLNPLLGSACNTYPVDGDEVNIKGVIDTINTPVLSLGRLSPDVNIILQAWDIVNNGIWLIETVDIAGDVTFIKEETGSYYGSVLLRDFGFLKSSAGEVEVFEFDELRSNNVDVEFKNGMIYTEGDIRIANTYYTDFFMYGCTAYTSGDLYFIHHSNTHFSIYDSILKASNIYEDASFTSSSESPSESSSLSPSASESPSPSASESLSESPSLSPSSSESPSSSPSESPSSSRSESPSESLSESPSTSLSESPSESQSSSSSESPSISPSSEPSFIESITIDTLYATGNPGAGSSVQVDSSGIPHCSFYSGSSNDYDLWYVRGDGAGGYESIQILDSSGTSSYPYAGEFTSLNIDSSGTIHILYSYRTGGLTQQIRYIYSTNGGVSFSSPVTAVASMSPGSGVDSDVDSSNTVHLCYRNNGRYYHISGGPGGWGAATDISGFTGTDTNLDGPSCAVDSSDIVHVVFPNNTFNTLQYVKEDGVGGWTSPVIADNGGGALDDVGTKCRMVIDNSDRIHIVSFASFAAGVQGYRYVKDNGVGGFNIPITITLAVSVGESFADIAVESDGTPNIVYSHPYTDIYYTRGDGLGGFLTPESIISTSTYNKVSLALYGSDFYVPVEESTPPGPFKIISGELIGPSSSISPSQSLSESPSQSASESPSP